MPLWVFSTAGGVKYDAVVGSDVVVSVGPGATVNDGDGIDIDGPDALGIGSVGQ